MRATLGTAGHIDHGKTALVRALTGIDTDRLPEEKRRGITIDLGFAHLPLPDGGMLGIVDVPGHEAFVRNMVAGATGIDFALLVVAADEGVMPQTREHLAVLAFLGVPLAAIALTKTDLVDDEWLELAAADAREAVRAAGFEDAPALPVSARSGVGVEELRALLIEATRHASRHTTADLFRLPIDRAFTVRGTGTVVTGTVWSGSLAVDQVVRILPGDATARVRALQVHGSQRETVHAGERAAVALAGTPRDSLERGQVLVTDQAWSASTRMTVQVRLIDDVGLPAGRRVRVHLGTAEALGRITWLEQPSAPRGAGAWAQLRLEAPVVARAGDPFVLRSVTPVTTIGGGRVAEPAAPRRRRPAPAVLASLAAILDGTPADSVGAAVGLVEWAGAPTSQIPVRARVTPSELEEVVRESGAIPVGGSLLASGIVAEAGQRIVQAVRSYHHREPLRVGVELSELRRALPDAAAPGLPDYALAALAAAGALRIEDGLARLPDFTIAPDPERRAALDGLRAVYSSAGIAVTAPGELPQPLASRPDLPDLLRLLEREGFLVPVGLAHIAAAALAEAVGQVRTVLGGRTGLSASEFRAALPVSRKHLIPLLETLDRMGVTVRTGDLRAVPGGDPAPAPAREPPPRT